MSGFVIIKDDHATIEESEMLMESGILLSLTSDRLMELAESYSWLGMKRLTRHWCCVLASVEANPCSFANSYLLFHSENCN